MAIVFFLILLDGARNCSCNYLSLYTRSYNHYGPSTRVPLVVEKQLVYLGLGRLVDHIVLRDQEHLQGVYVLVDAYLDYYQFPEQYLPGLLY
jgi:hypothetical protein